MAYKVLLVEDDSDCRELLAELLGHMGYQVLQAENGAAAIETAMNQKPDLILMDLRMPNMDGIQTTARLRESGITKDTPIIICSALLQRQHQDSALKSGADEVVTKPVSFRQIESLIQRYLPLPHGQDETFETKLETLGLRRQLYGIKALVRRRRPVQYQRRPRDKCV